MADTDVTLIALTNRRLGNIPELLEVDIDKADIEMLIKDAVADLKDSGVPTYMLPSTPEDTAFDEQVATAIFCYVAAYIGTDRTLTNRYLTLYRNKTFRLTLNDDEEDF